VITQLECKDLLTTLLLVWRVQPGQRVQQGQRVQRGQRALKVQPVLTVLMELMANKVQQGQRALTVSMELMEIKVQSGQRVLRAFKVKQVVQIHRYLRYPQMQLSSLQIHLAQSKSFSNLQRIW
jgi:hypothetical protein